MQKVISLHIVSRKSNLENQKPGAGFPLQKSRVAHIMQSIENSAHEVSNTKSLHVSRRKLNLRKL